MTCPFLLFFRFTQTKLTLSRVNKVAKLQKIFKRYHWSATVNKKQHGRTGGFEDEAEATEGVRDQDAEHASEIGYRGG